MHDVVAQVQRFLEWASRKVGLHFAEHSAKDFRAADVWWASLGENIGSEMNGKNYRFERPVIIVRRLSQDMMLVVPSTSKKKQGDWYYEYECNGSRSCAVVAQIRVISNRRLIRRVGRLDASAFEGLRDAVVSIIRG